MNKNIFIIASIGIAVIGLGGILLSEKDVPVKNDVLKTASSNQPQVVLHKSPTCGCCGVWGKYMEKEGYSVAVHETHDLGEVKRSLRVPYDVESCHTAEIGGYVVEGHIPNEAIIQLLTEKPDIAGIGMAGMPAGSPGMPGPKTGDFVIYEITHDGEKGSIFMTI